MPSLSPDQRRQNHEKMIAYNFSRLTDAAGKVQQPTHARVCLGQCNQLSELTRVAIPVVTLSLGLQLTKPRTPNAEGLKAEVLMVENGLHFPPFALRFLGFPHLTMTDVI